MRERGGGVHFFTTWGGVHIVKLRRRADSVQG